MVWLLEHHEIDTHFFELHVAIDNVANGHGAMAQRAVKLFLERTRTELGDEAMQTQWQRIWNGYVAFATTGTLAEDIRKEEKRLPRRRSSPRS